jgi:hypothetical protein
LDSLSFFDSGNSSLSALSRAQTYRWKVYPFRLVSTERGLEHNVWHLYGGVGQKGVRR